MSNNTNSPGGGVFLGLLCILFIGLKLGGIITWSWWWVMSPLWGAFALVMTGLAIAAVFVIIKELLK